MPFTIYVTRDFDQMSQVAAEIVETDIREKQASKEQYILGLATGNSPTGLYRRLAGAFNEGRVDPERVRSFNLDEYVGLPGENAQQRALHPESYTFFMIQELFGLLDTKLCETNVPWGTLVEQKELISSLEAAPGDYEVQGTDLGKAIVIRDGADGVLGTVKRTILDAYEEKIAQAGGIDLHVVGVGGRGHVAFHESGIPFEGNRMLLVRLDENTACNAVDDGHFPCAEDCPRYAISMGAELVYTARTVLLVANGARKTGPVAESIFGPVTPDVPISYGQRYAEGGGNLVYVLDEAAAEELLARVPEAESKGYKVIDVRGAS